MSFEELDHRTTPLGDLVLRRRRLPGTPDDAPLVYEITLDGAFLMSSLVHESETALAAHALAACPDRPLDVLVGGLGLGHTAEAALADDRVASLTAVERLGAVIAWHREGRVPLGAMLTADPRCEFVEDDFFELIDRRAEEASYDLVLLDVDHSPRALLHPSHAAFYEVEGLERLRARLRVGGVFGLWSADAEDGAFLARLQRVFASARAERVTFHNPSVGAEDVNTVYVACREREA
jgi:spermidine synthase